MVCGSNVKPSGACVWSLQRRFSTSLRGGSYPARSVDVSAKALGKRRCFPRVTSKRPCSVTVQCNAASQETIPDRSVSVVLLAGGVGKRMGAKIPKQYIDLRGRAIATYSLATFSTMREVGEIVIVCDPSWRYVFEDYAKKSGMGIPITWASPGAERQDSVFNGLQAVRDGSILVAIHDSARPLVLACDVSKCLVDGKQVGAAVLGVKVKPTIKEVDQDGFVVQTLKRDLLWEVQTPQVIEPNLLKEGFELVKRDGLEVTDDVSIVEAMGRPVKITQGSYTNIKVTTPDDLSVAERFLDEQQETATATASA